MSDSSNTSQEELLRIRIEGEFAAIMGPPPVDQHALRVYEILKQGSQADKRCKVLADVDPTSIYMAIQRHGEEFANALSAHLQEWSHKEMCDVTIPTVNQGWFRRFLIQYLFVKRYGSPDQYEGAEAKMYYSLREGCCLAGGMNLADDVGIAGLNRAVGDVTPKKRFWYNQDIQTAVANSKEPLSMADFSSIILNAKKNKPFTQQENEKALDSQSAFE
jgi:hypothetical protein